MSKTVLNLFPSRVPIGELQSDGSVLMTQAFSRALSAVFERIGGAQGMNNEDLALLSMSDQSALIASLAVRLAELDIQVAQLAGAAAEVSVLRRRLADVELLAAYRDPYRVNWERPGRIGFFTPNTGSFTTVNKLTLTPPATAATFTLANTKTFTVSNTLTLTATDGAALAIGAGGTLGSAAYQNTSAFAARSNTVLAAVATDPASTQALANSLRAVLISVGIGT